ncbi:MAG TPA: nucleoside triphosphate pyrophosphohydrolase family protein [Candidatus Saccharibacteria bacterium]|nr:nucleoside triphosphate pyrophosphohydrolase family protein [Candidatus Saccharibacteria bacterium]
MTLNDYQTQARTTFTIENDLTRQVTYLALGLNGEAGEVAEKIKKILRDTDVDFKKLNLDDIKKELGDVLWYVSTLSNILGLELEDVAKTNLEKLSSRKERGALQGSGDNR